MARKTHPTNWSRFPVRTHPDVEFAVDGARGALVGRTFDTFDQAAGYALALAGSGVLDVTLDTLVFSREGAVWFAGDEGGEEYDEDEEASVFNRLEITVNNVGRIA